MIFMLLLIISIVSWWVFWYLDSRWTSVRYETPLFISAFGAIIFSIVILIWSIISYTDYVDMRADWDVVVKQYKQSVTVYSDKAVLSLNDSSLTDFKYQGYQDNLARFVLDMRWRVSEYNEAYVTATVLKKNPLCSWFISAPDPDMKIIELGGNE